MWCYGWYEICKFRYAQWQQVVQMVSSEIAHKLEILFLLSLKLCFVFNLLSFSICSLMEEEEELGGTSSQADDDPEVTQFYVNPIAKPIPQGRAQTSLQDTISDLNMHKAARNGLEVSGITVSSNLIKIETYHQSMETYTLSFLTQTSTLSFSLNLTVTDCVDSQIITYVPVCVCVFVCAYSAEQWWRGISGGGVSAGGEGGRAAGNSTVSSSSRLDESQTTSRGRLRWQFL